MVHACIYHAYNYYKPNGHHVQDEHTWIIGQCNHVGEDGILLPLEPPADADGKQLHYFSKTGPDTEALKKIVLDPKLIKSLKYYIHFQ